MDRIARDGVNFANAHCPVPGFRQVATPVLAESIHVRGGEAGSAEEAHVRPLIFRHDDEDVRFCFAKGLELEGKQEESKAMTGGTFSF